MNLIDLKGIKKTYLLGQTKVPALSGVDLAIEAGEFTVFPLPDGPVTTVNSPRSIARSTPESAGTRVWPSR